MALNLTFIYLMILELLLANSAVLIINYHQKKVDFGGLQEMTVCELCYSAKLGDEYHHIFDCTYFWFERHEFIPKDFREKLYVHMILELFTSSDKQVSFRLAKFCKLIQALFS